MTDTLLRLVSDYGLVVIALCTLLSCLAMPLPASLMMMAGGAFAAAGDLVLWQVCAAAFIGAITGDHIGYWAARRFGGVRVWAWLRKQRRGAQATARLLHQAEGLVQRRGGWAVYLTRWLFSPLGPYVNLIAGATRMPWRTFTTADLAGEATWVALYVTLGFTFGSQIEEVSNTLGSVIGALTAGMITALLARALWRKRRTNR
ncbi:membrane protein DedA, SNARE-associated domain [Pseudorhodobacter antarcticus]|jgi:membrane protein DedA with SNARE-associated domain|uniref:Membrane protein DedA, SNARE-associated domain n=1 Tax=Pseudorhodobacter antarcticus TaxID=1077947 RepID=A0A1H8CZJ9_9RHOB|nr:DedA family protein [Pseudorhodobacter antarcticus]SEN00405.1 membrane protein DedA, SNARE-associated domain [Pseudorhodobacter antarcticus]